MKLSSVLYVTIALITFTLHAKESQIDLMYGVDEKGSITKNWIGYSPDKQNEKKQRAELKPLTEQEQKWAKLIADRVSIWQTQLDKIAVPFASTEVPRHFSIVMGNRGGRDAFTYPSQFPKTIFFNLSVLNRSYGDASSESNRQRIDRIFAHEFTHLLQDNWSEKHPYPITSHVKYALNESYKEGFGHYRSISNKWKDSKGVITEHAENTLKKLELEFVKRIALLASASDEDAKQHLRGLATGPFNKKWGALTVALWLTKEAKGNDHNLIKWVDLGPNGVLQLANKHLPEKLRVELNNSLKHQF